MICNLCGDHASMRNDGTYAAHMNAELERCSAGGITPDEALAKRRTFYGPHKSWTLIRLIGGADGIGVHASANLDDMCARVWVTISADDARRMAAELLEMADIQDQT